MNEEQLKAIKSVERAMKKLENTGLSLAGVDGELLAFDDKEFRKISANDAKTRGWEPAPGQIMSMLDYHSIRCPYVDSCAT